MKLIITLRILMLMALVGGIAYFAHRRGYHFRSKRAPAPVAAAAPQVQNPDDGAQYHISEAEYSALVDIYYITSGNRWRNHSGWLNPKAASWFGVNVSDGHVIELDLSENNLTGRLPPSLGDLPMLRRLDLSGNFLIGSVPAAVGDLYSLQELVLRGNLFDGLLPDSLTNLVRLKRLDLSENQLTGTVPATLETLTNLTSLDLSHNRLNWTIPDKLDILARLQELKLSANYLAGRIPESLNALRALTNLSLANNQLSGIVPALTALRNATIDLTGNRLDIDAGSPSLSNIQAVINAGNSVKFQPQLTIGSDAPKFAKPRKKPAPPTPQPSPSPAPPRP